ncbi:MAG: TolC family protein [Myxococcales bacterium]
MLRWSAPILGLLTLTLAARAQAEVVTLSFLEKRALEADGFEDTHAAKSRGSEAELRRTAAAYYPQVTLRVGTNILPGSQLLTVCGVYGSNPPSGKQEGDPKPCGKNFRENQFQVQGARTFSQGGDAFVPVVQNRLEVAASAPIYDFGRTKAAVDAGKASLSAVRAERDAEGETLVRQVRVAYLNWLSAHEIARVTEAAARDAEERFARVSALVEEGSKPKAELPPAHSDALLTKLELTRAQGDLANAQQVLEDAVGEPLPPGAEPELSLIEDTNAQVVALSYATDAMAQVIEKQRTAAEKLELSYKKQNLPQLALSALVGARNQQSHFFPLYAAGLSFFVPLYDGGLSRALASSARAQRDALDAQLRAHMREQESLHLKAERDADQALDSLSIANQLLTVAEKQLHDAQAGYDLGVNGIEQIAGARALVRRAQTEVLLSKVAHAEARMRVAPVDTSP